LQCIHGHAALGGDPEDGGQYKGKPTADGGCMQQMVDIVFEFFFLDGFGGRSAIATARTGGGTLAIESVIGIAMKIGSNLQIAMMATTMTKAATMTIQKKSV
jgi:hypothetical protein